MPRTQNFFVTTAWLAGSLRDASIAIVDASWYLPAAQRDPEAEYLAGHIPGAVRFDIDAVADRATSLPHMLPTADEFAQAVGALGISDQQTIVVYDGAGLASAPRVWWTLRAFGAREVVILEGGLPKWRAEGRPLESGSPILVGKRFRAHLKQGAVVGFDEVRRRLAAGSAQILDARPGARFDGTAPEPRAGVRSGHMPGSFSLPSGDLIADGRLRPAAELAQAFAKSGVDLQKPIITSCGSGVTAAILTLAAETLGAKKLALYDGSWTDWASRQGAAIEP